MSQGLTGVSQAAARQASTVSATTLTLPNGPMDATYPITGTTTITSITAGQAGRRATLEFQSANCTVVNGSNLKLAGRSFISTALRTLDLESDGTNWIERSRGAFGTTVVTTANFADVAAAGATGESADVAHVHGMPSAPYYQNAIVNGDMGIAQRWTSIANPSSYILDQWIWGAAGPGAVTGSQQADVPAVGTNAINTPSSLRILVTTPNTSLIAGAVYFVYQTIEGYDYQALTNGFAVSFWVRSALTGIHCIAFRNRNGDRSYVAEYTVNVANTWEYKTAVVPTPPTAGLWGNYQTNIGVYVNFTMASGTTFQTTAGVWQTGNFLATSNQVNVMHDTNNIFAITMVNIVPGATPQPYTPVRFAIQWERARRYCQKFVAAGSGRYAPGFSDSATQQISLLALPTTMMSVPTATFTAASTFWIYQMGNVFTPTALAVSIPRADMVPIVASGVTGLTVGAGGMLMDSGGGTSSILLEAAPT